MTQQANNRDLDGTRAIRSFSGQEEARFALTVAALQQPGTYWDETRLLEIETVETHMSFVFLTEKYAYKLKKPIRTKALDFSTVDSRRLACEAELRLNRRLAPGVYLAVVPVVMVEGKVALQQTGQALDWVVKMRRLPRERMLDRCIQDQIVKDEDVTSLAALLSKFYATSSHGHFDGPSYRKRISSDIASKRRSLGEPRYQLDPTILRRACLALEEWLARHGVLLESRATMVVDAHGDLRPEHVCLENSRPAIIDCLEFNQSLRLLDPASELSFLALECRRLGAAWIGKRLFAEYAQLSGDRVPLALIQFYQGHHALIRAAIALWHLDNGVLGSFEKWRERGNWYLQMVLDSGL